MQNKIFLKIRGDFGISLDDAQRVIKKHLRYRKKENAWIELDIVGKAKMRRLNRDFLNHDYATDVLSFPVADFPTVAECDFIGTVVVCSDIIKSQAKKLNKSFDEEFYFYVCHGIDHLVGIHHK
jgi:probable rRNA maturation factor